MESAPPTHVEAATDEPAPSENLPRLFGARVSDALREQFESLLEDATQPGSGRARRQDGWTPDRIRTFLVNLAQNGVVADAARATGISVPSAYRFRNRAEGRAFHHGWNAAILISRRRLADDVMSRAVHGCVELIERDGQVWGRRHRFDNRLTMAVLTGLYKHRLSDGEEGEIARIVAEEFDQYLDIVCAGGGEAAADFIAVRRNEERSESAVLARLENYRRYSVGHPAEIDIADLDPDAMNDWTEEQAERAERSGLLRELAVREQQTAREAVVRRSWSTAPDGTIWMSNGMRISPKGIVTLSDGTRLTPPCLEVPTPSDPEER